MSHNTVQLHPVGTRGWLVDLPDLESVMAWHAALSTSPLKGQEEVIAAARTVLVLFATRKDTLQAKAQLEAFTPAQHQGADPRHVTIDVVYDGEDLHGVAELMGISAEELIQRHTEQRWMAAFGGFAPGFTYCVPTLDADAEHNFDWDVPRLETPRTTVPDGAVALAGNFSAVYPRTSPGGWQLIGHTEDKMWDTSAQPPALLQPGDLVSYRAVRDGVEISTKEDHSTTESTATNRADVASRPAFTIEGTGMQSLFQDAGRRGYGDMGVNHSGAADKASAWAANNVLGNPSKAVVIENIGGLSLKATTDSAICVTGAEATVTVGEKDYQLAEPILVRAGQTITVTPNAEPNTGLRHYVAARGGFVTEQVLESSSRDILSGLGPKPLERGDVCKVGRRTADASVGQSTLNPLDTSGTLRCIPGPRDAWFSDEELKRFCSVDWVVSGQSNRVGLRLALPEDTDQPLQRCQDGELASEGMVSGCIQVPPSGLPVVFLADHPVTGGYPVIATVVEPDLSIAAQLSPGERVRFAAVDPETLEPLFPTR